MLSKSRFLGLHLRVDKGCLLGKKGPIYGQDLWWEHWGIRVVVKLMCGCTCICAIYVCMYVFMCVCLCSEARCRHDVSSLVTLHPIFLRKAFHWSGIYLLASLAIQQALWTPPTLPSQTWVTSACYCTLLSMQMLGSELRPPCLHSQRFADWAIFPALVNVYFIVAIIVCALGMEPRVLQMPNQDSTTDLPSSSVHFSWSELHKIALKGSPPSSKSTYFQNHFPLLLFITAFCSVVLRNRTENHHVTLAKLTLQGSATSTCIIPREEKKRVCQAHAENIITKPTRICKSVSPIVHLHGVSLALPNLNTKISIFFSLLKLISFMGFTAWKANRLNS